MTGQRSKRLVALLLVMLFAVPAKTAHAEWLRSESDHFVVYADDSEKDIRLFSEQLERYHSAMALVTSADAPRPSPSNRVTIYVVDTARDVRKLYGENSRYVGGFYLPRAGGSLAIVPSVRTVQGEVSGPMLTLLHEYAHHFLHTSSTFPLPRWYSEGMSEFFASASFSKDGGVGLGRPAKHRGPELFLSQNVTAEELVDPDSYANSDRKRFDAFYGKAWLLTHYLSLGDQRRGQLRNYLKAIASGTPQREAAEQVFGDLRDLEMELQSYLRRRRMIYLDIPPTYLTVGAVSVHPLSAGEAEIMPLRIRSKRGVDAETAAELVGEARTVAARYPRDPAVLSALAEAEYDAGNSMAAIAAADAALAIDPGQVNAYVQKGYALFALARQADDRDAAYKAAFQPFHALNRLENDHPLPLIYLYRSFRARDAEPSDVAISGLERAAELAPFDLGLRLSVATQQIRNGRKAQARKTLEPVAYNPHGGQLAELAQSMIAKLDGKQGGGASLDEPAEASAGSAAAAP